MDKKYIMHAYWAYVETCFILHNKNKYRPTFMKIALRPFVSCSIIGK